MSAVKNALKKGLIKINSFSYPVLISVRHFPQWNSSAFGEDNGITAIPGKSEVRKAIREALVHLTLSNMLVDGKFGDDPDVSQVSSVFRKVERNISAMMPKEMDIGSRDLILAKAYVRALKDFVFRNSKAKKFLEKNSHYLEMPKKPKKDESKKQKTRKTKNTRTRTQSQSQSRTKAKTRALKAEIQEMIKAGEVRKLSRSPRDADQFVDMYLNSAAFSKVKAQTDKTKKKAESNRRKLFRRARK
jgi:hypothetical protein